MNRTLLYIQSVLLLLMSLVIHVNAQDDLAIRTTVDQSTLAVNQQLLFTIEVSGKDANKVNIPDPPDMGGYLQFIGNGGTAQNIQFVNGKMSVTKSQKYYYMAVKEGNYTIPAITVVNQNKQVSSQPIDLSILQSAATQPSGADDGKSKEAAGAATDDLFLRTIVSKKTVYQNEPVLVSYRIFKAANVNLNNYSINKLPETVGFWAEEIDVGQQPKIWEDVINGKKYVLADIKKQVVFPSSPGKKSVGGLGIDCNIRVAQRRNRDIFDNFFDDPFFSRTVTKTIFSNPVDINVLPLPQANKPANFSGLVGRFNMKSSVDKSEVKTNEAVTLKIDISGMGNIKMIPTPQLIIPNDFEHYEPKISENISRQNDSITGSKSFEFVLVPRFPGEQHIKPFVLYYFDPVEKAYKTQSTPEFVFHVSKGNDDFVSASPGLSKEEVKLVGQDIRFIKQSSSGFSPVDSRIYRTAAFYMILIFPLFLLGGALAYNKHLVKLSGNVAYARSRRANALAMKHLGKAKKLLHEETQKEFYAEASRALLGFAADKLNIEAAGIITTELESGLVKKGVEPELVKTYIGLVQHSDFQRFAPSNVALDDMNTFYSKAKDAIIGLEKAL